MTHPFDRYGPFTDVAALKEISAKPLRKSLRVNLLKNSIEEVKKWGKEKGWEMTPVPWVDEAFFIDRVNREEALGKDLLHLLGHTYMQEAASMLPPALLDPQPHQTVLDMSAAPGSKTTQMASSMKNTGVIVANDVQEKRLWTLKSALHRSGVINTIVTRKVGQWFGKHMTERFDRVLCDAPCTAQGTARKDSDALKYCSIDNINKMARLQKELLTAAVHACKVGGRIVYSTCTLTPEENEELVFSVLKLFPDQLEVIDPRSIHPRFESLTPAIEDSIDFQKKLNWEKTYPMVRLWPQTLDTEGFFSVLIEKKAPTLNAEYYKVEHFQEEEMPAARKKEWGEVLTSEFGTSFLGDDDRLYERGEHLLLANHDVAKFQMPVVNYSLGLPFGKRVTEKRQVRLDHDLVTLRGMQARESVCEIDEATLDLLLDGKDAKVESKESGDTILMYKGMPVGVGLFQDGGLLKNRLPRWIVQKS